MKSEPTISIIVAMASNRAIGKDNSMPWRLPADLKHFKKITTGHAVIMGRKTFESLPAGPLPNRRNIVLSENLKVVPDGCELAENIEEALALTQNEEEVFVIGGGTIYEQFLPLTNKLYLTIIEKEFEADTFFPLIDFRQWEITEKEVLDNDLQVNFVYRFETYERK
ncbi:MAG: dihydrofolate reductase [Bacteroidetes bacterium]|jgi:dihydrofolate reductase|nr:dihydrofolate reductase [Bacteroidota bacterium]MBU1578242.1 dihydrofolate reductase [Bacteroidota bacterium]MBU2556414.1 dihydrofolate reductase [Bacteroidota bacterium]MDA3943959.1 dihydrofolate reductase [Bacteroidota bacterium]